MQLYNKRGVTLRGDTHMATSDKTEKKFESCGYISKSKNARVLIVMVKHQRFIVNVDGLEKVIAGKLEYTPIYEHIDGDKTNATT